MPGPRDPDQLGARHLGRQVQAQRRGDETVLVADHDDRRHPADRGQGVPQVHRVQGLAERRHHLDRGRPDHLLQEVDQGRVHPGIAEPDEPGGQERDVAGYPAALLDQHRPVAGRRAAQHHRERAAQHGPRGAGHPRAARIQPAGRGGDQSGPGHLGAEQAGVLPGQRHDRHRTHGVADQQDRLVTRGHRLDDPGQVRAQPVHAGRAAARGPPGPAVVPLIPEHHPVPAPQRGPLEVPAVLVQRVPVAEDQGRRPRAAAARGRRRVRLVDLDVQRDPVVRQHGQRLAAQLTQVLRRRVAAQHLDPADRDPLGGHEHASTCGHRTRAQPDRPGDPPPGRHAHLPPLPAGRRPGRGSRQLPGPRPAVGRGRTRCHAMPAQAGSTPAVRIASCSNATPE